MEKSKTALKLLESLAERHELSTEDYEVLISSYSEGIASEARKLAGFYQRRCYGNSVYVRGLIEIGNLCSNDCFYCGIRRSNRYCHRYRMGNAQILDCCKRGYAMGFRTFVLQSGEVGSGEYIAAMCNLISEIRKQYPDCAITLSLGEYSKDVYQKFYDAGAERYLLRHETADEEHYQKLHPKEMSFLHRRECLQELKEIGYQTGCGFMVGSPFQTVKTLAKDLKFIEEFRPEMCGIGPFIPHKDTPFRECTAGSTELTLYLLSLIRIQNPNILLPATTALSTVSDRGHQLGILAGANVIMPNLTPESHRAQYSLYNGKKITGSEDAEKLSLLKEDMKQIGYQIVVSRGDPVKYTF